MSYEFADKCAISYFAMPAWEIVLIFLGAHALALLDAILVWGLAGLLRSGVCLGKICSFVYFFVHMKGINRMFLTRLRVAHIIDCLFATFLKRMSWTNNDTQSVDLLSLNKYKYLETLFIIVILIIVFCIQMYLHRIFYIILVNNMFGIVIMFLTSKEVINTDTHNKLSFVDLLLLFHCIKRFNHCFNRFYEILKDVWFAFALIYFDILAVHTLSPTRLKRNLPH
ncbi:hypothetical protein RFI_24077 [Reticulomyxa filosa]|uniref:Uncharacterized protein n=1 Tax=Reticulomyxa filosa TaxID=46433 RepID=X6MHD9_RETFI|nr:hypothetical protein RFI_24077 [Reticulomyxa filosa]|eukprot:ETO13299.1 hypothetical protein RFI_24077 [Reticulomyxa filosa]